MLIYYATLEKAFYSLIVVQKRAQVISRKIKIFPELRYVAGLGVREKNFSDWITAKYKPLF